MYELSTVFGTEDLYDLLEIMKVDAHNQRVYSKHQAAKRGS